MEMMLIEWKYSESLADTEDKLQWHFGILIYADL